MRSNDVISTNDPGSGLGNCIMLLQQLVYTILALASKFRRSRFPGNVYIVVDDTFMYSKYFKGLCD